MTRILALVSAHVHGHDYGVDALLAGFWYRYQYGTLMEWPPKACLHLPGPAARDGCSIASDYWFPRYDDADLHERLAHPDVCLLAMQPRDSTCAFAAGALRKLGPDVPIIAYDASDWPDDMSEFYASVAGRAVDAMFKRELPYGATWAKSLPLTYPGALSPAIVPHRREVVFYHAASHSGCASGISDARAGVIDSIRSAINPQNVDAELHDGASARLGPEEYRCRMSSALIGPAWNGGDAWDSWRVWELFAHGVCVILQKPTIQMQPAPRDEVECLYAESPGDVGDVARRALGRPDVAAAIGARGREWFLRYHCAERRAERVMEVADELAKNQH